MTISDIINLIEGFGHDPFFFYDPENIVSLGEGDSPILTLSRISQEIGVKRIIIKDEGNNPTHSFKARGLSAAISKAKELDLHDFIVPTAGNAGAALAALTLGLVWMVFPEAVHQNFPATCLESALGSQVDRTQVLVRVLDSIKKWRKELGSTAFMQRWEEHLAFKGEWVRIEHSEKPSIIGRVKGIDQKGHLVLVQENGREIDIEIGDVHLRPGLPADMGGFHA